MIILTKCAAEEAAFRDRSAAGSDQLEIYVEDASKLDADNTLMLLQKYNMGIHVIHSPLLEKTSEFLNLSDLLHSEGITALSDTISYASKVASYQNSLIRLVIHAAPLRGSERSAVFCILDELLHKFPHVIYSIENTSMLTVDGTTRTRLQMGSGGLFTNVQNVIDMQSIPFLGSRCGTCLDIAHVHADICFMKALYKRYKRSFKQEDFRFGAYLDAWVLKRGAPSLRDFMQANAKYLNLIHLANSRNLALTSASHGVAFSKDCSRDMKRLRKFGGLYEELQLACPVTLEVAEQSYPSSVEVMKTLEALKLVSEVWYENSCCR